MGIESLKLGTVPLLNPDGSGLLRSFYDCYISLEDMRLFGMQPIPLNAQRDDIGYANYSQPHEYRLNTFYHYSGAGRWSFGLFVVDTETVAQLPGRSYTLSMQSDSGANVFSGDITEFDAGQNFTNANLFETTVYPLPARQLSHSGLNDAWLVPVVDERWFWQFETVTISNADTWASVYAGLGITLDEAVEAEYLKPNKDRIQGVPHNKAALLDAVLASTGRWYEPRLAKAYSYSKSLTLAGYQSTLLGENPLPFETLGTVIAGGVSGYLNTAPEVTVIFPGYEPCKKIKDADPYEKAVGGSNVIIFDRAFHSTALADRTGGGAPVNQTELDDLAGKIYADYLPVFRNPHDLTYAGIKGWFLNGQTDFVEYQFGSQRADGHAGCQTRVHSLPYNFGVNLLMHESDSGFTEADAKGCKEGIVLTAIAAAGTPGASSTGTVAVYEIVGGAWTSTGETLTVTNRDDSKSWEAGEYIMFCTQDDECRPVTNPPDIDENTSGNDGDDGEDGEDGSGSGNGDPLLVPPVGGGCPEGYTKVYVQTARPLTCPECDSEPGSDSGDECTCPFQCVRADLTSCDTCQDESGSGSGPTVQTDCCEDEIPETLRAALVATDPACSCVDEEEITLTYTGASPHTWTGTKTLCTSEVWGFTLTCDSENWRMSVAGTAGCPTGSDIAPTTALCDPLELLFSGFDVGSCCNGGAAGGATMSVLVTE